MEIIHRWKLTLIKYYNLETPEIIKKIRAQGGSLDRAMRIKKKGFGKRIYHTFDKPTPGDIHEKILEYYKEEQDLRIVAKLEEVWETNAAKFVPA